MRITTIAAGAALTAIVLSPSAFAARRHHEARLASVPVCAESDDTSASDCLKAARFAMERNRIPAARENLERASTRVLGGSIPRGDTGVPGDLSMVSRIHDALTALSDGQTARAREIVDLALAR